ncbi:MAG: ATP-binding protein [Schleiferiaceae bacterium]
MNFDQTSRISIGVAAVVTLLVWATMYITGVIGGYAIPVLLSAYAALVVGLLTFFTVRFAIHSFIYQKIKILFKTIHELKVGNEVDEDNLAKTTDLAEVDKEVKEWAKERNSEIAQLKERENYRREFIGNVSHELKTPIFNIQGYLLTLIDGGIDDPNINVKYIKRANKSVERMINLIQDMDTINMLEQGRIDIQWSQFDIIALVRDVYEVLESKATKRGIELSIPTPPAKSLWVEGDRNKIEQVVINLVNNAIKYGEENGQVEVRFFDAEGNYLIEVTDDGYGIPEEDLSRIFERFYRVDKSRTRDAGGSGLGLSIVKHIVEAHNQSIHVRSKVGTGSTFSFTLKKGKKPV